MNKEQFYIGQRVKQWDEYENCFEYGHIKEIKDKSILIKWNDLEDLCEHFEDEFPTIKDGNPPSYKANPNK